LKYLKPNGPIVKYIIEVTLFRKFFLKSPNEALKANSKNRRQPVFIIAVAQKETK